MRNSIHLFVHDPHSNVEIFLQICSSNSEANASKLLENIEYNSDNLMILMCLIIH